MKQVGDTIVALEIECSDSNFYPLRPFPVKPKLKDAAILVEQLLRRQRRG
jgi:hypothetical protein